jgi:hypothetical protein
MNIYKLNYTNKETAIADLIAKGVYTETEEGLAYAEGVQAIVEIGKIVLIDGTYDEEGDEITVPVYADGYHYDVMAIQEIDFALNEVQVKNPKHSFAGCINNEEIVIP